MTLGVCALATPVTTALADYDVWPQKVKKIISTDKNILVGDRFELHAKVSPWNADEDDALRWKIVGKKGIVRIMDDDFDHDDELELKAVKSGTTKIRCSIIGKGKKFSKTITIRVKKNKNNNNQYNQNNDWNNNNNNQNNQNNDWNNQYTQPSQPVQNNTVTTRYTREEVWDDFDLEVRGGMGVSYQDLQWSIADTNIVSFDHGEDGYGSEVEFRANNLGTTTVTCTNLKTGEITNFIVEVTPDYDD